MFEELKKALEYQSKLEFAKAKEIYSKYVNSRTLEQREFALTNLANIFFLEKDFQRASKLYDFCIEINSNNQKAIYNYGVLELNRKNYEKAKKLLEMSINLNPNHFSSILNLAIANKNLKNYKESKELFDKGIEIKPNDADLIYNYGNLYLALEDYQKALILFKKALTINHKNSKIYYGLGLVYHRVHKDKIAIEYFDKAIAINPKYYDALFAKSLSHLQLGDYKNGWEYYRYRFEATNDLKKVDYGVRHYEGEDLKDKTILVQGEQGFGDNIEFSRFIIYLLGAKKIYFALRDPLLTLFEESFSKYENIEIIKNKTTLKNVDYFISLMELPRIFKEKNIFRDVKIPYLNYKEKKYDIKFNNKKINIGFSYKGNSEHKNDHNRSIMLQEFEILLKNQNIDFYSLQIDNNNDIIPLSKKYKNLKDLKPFINDFNDTANFVNKLDLVITIDSSLVHLCGALNVKTILLLPKYYEWRWANQPSFKWYNSIIFKVQKNVKDWSSIFNELEKEIKKTKKS